MKFTNLLSFSSYILTPLSVMFNQVRNANWLNMSFYYYGLSNFITSLSTTCAVVWKRTVEDGFYILWGLFLVFGADALIIDDEPLWEPVEWSMVQSWILFIFMFGWIAENLIVSRYGSYTGRDKRVWFSWYKTFWLIDMWYVLSFGAATLFVIVPFYYEVNYLMSFTLSWWNWYSRVFFFKFLVLYTWVLFLAYVLQINLRSFNVKKSLFFIIIINLFLFYLLYIHFFMSFFSYFTNANWYNDTRMIDYVQLSHEPNKWSWGNKKRDHFSYHRSATVFWFKNDGPMAAAFMMFHFFFFFSLLSLSLYWVVLLRRVYASQEVSYTYTTYAVSSLKQFYYFFLLLYLFIFMSYIVAYWRFPVEYSWMLGSYSWFDNFLLIVWDYPYFIWSIWLL